MGGAQHLGPEYSPGSATKSLVTGRRGTDGGGQARPLLPVGAGRAPRRSGPGGASSVTVRDGRALTPATTGRERRSGEERPELHRSEPQGGRGPAQEPERRSRA